MTAAEKQALLQCLDHLRDGNLAALKVLSEIAPGYIFVDQSALELDHAGEAIERLRTLLLP